jgi:hypothetical protein
VAREPLNKPSFSRWCDALGLGDAKSASLEFSAGRDQHAEAQAVEQHLAVKSRTGRSLMQLAT